MSKVITFSTTFPSYHPRKGEDTDFAYKIIDSLRKMDVYKKHRSVGLSESTWMDQHQIPLHLQSGYWKRSFAGLLKPKYHTIRAGNRWNVGEKFSPRIWSGKPYNSKQIIIAPDIEIKKVFPITIRRILGDIIAYNPTFVVNPHDDITDYEISKLAMNDGLSKEDFIEWFNKDFEGQIICWNENINY